MRSANRLGVAVAASCCLAVGLGGCGKGEVISRHASSVRNSARYFLVLTRYPDLKLVLCSVRTGRIVRSFNAGRPIFYANNGATVSADGRDVYLSNNATAIERIPIGTGKSSTIANDGIWPSISPDGRLLAYVKPDSSLRSGDGLGGTVLVIRDLRTGKARSIDLIRLIGHGGGARLQMLAPMGTTNGFMTWLADGTDVALIPMETAVSIGAPRPALRGPCAKGCVLVVHAGSMSGALSVTRYAGRGLMAFATIAPDAGDPHALLAASGGDIDRIELTASRATVEHLHKGRPIVEPEAFNASGNKLLYVLGNALQHVWLADISARSTSSITGHKIAGQLCMTPIAW